MKHVTEPTNAQPVVVTITGAPVTQPPVLRLKLPPHVERNRVKYKGQVYEYLAFRLKGGPRIRLPDYYHPDFPQAYRNALAGSATAIRTGNHEVGAGSVEAALIAYYQSTAWLVDLSAGTRVGRKTTLENFRRQFGTCKMRSLKREDIQALVKDLSQPMQAQWRKSLRGFFGWATAEGLMREDITQGVKIRKRKTGEGAKMWGEEQLAQYRKTHKLGTMARLAIEIMAGTGVRVSDAGRIGKQHVDGKNVLTFTPKKTSKSTGAQITVHLQPALLQAVKTMKVVGEKHWLVTDTGKQFTPAYLRKHVRTWCDEAGLGDCSSHGLRKLFLTMLADDGASLMELKAASGDSDLAVLQKYIDKANMKRAAAMTGKRMAKRKAVA